MQHEKDLKPEALTEMMKKITSNLPDPLQQKLQKDENFTKLKAVMEEATTDAGGKDLSGKMDKIIDAMAPLLNSLAPVLNKEAKADGEVINVEKMKEIMHASIKEADEMTKQFDALAEKQKDCAKHNSIQCNASE